MAEQPVRLTKAGKALAGMLVVSLGFWLGTAGSAMLGHPLFSFEKKGGGVSPSAFVAALPAEGVPVFPVFDPAVIDDFLIAGLVAVDVPELAGVIPPLIEEINVGTMQEVTAVAGDVPVPDASLPDIAPAAGKTMVEVPPEMLELLKTMMVPAMKGDVSIGGDFGAGQPQVFRGGQGEVRVFSPKGEISPETGKLVITSATADKDMKRKEESVSSPTRGSGVTSPSPKGHGVTVTYGRSGKSEDVTQENGVTVYRGTSR